MKTLILSTDQLTPQFDRRILDLNDQLARYFDSTCIVTIGEETKVEFHRGKSIFQLSRHPRKIMPAEWKKIFLQGIEDKFIEENQVQEKDKSFIRKIWAALPFRIKKILIPLLNQVLKLAQINDILKIIKSEPYGLNIASDYWDYAYSLIKANSNQNYDLYIGTDLGSGIAAYILSKMKNGKSWYEAHEFATQQKWLRDQPGFSDELISIEKILVKNSDIFSTVSRGLCATMQQEFDRKLPSFILTNATKIDLLETSSKEHIEIFKTVKQEKKVLLFHGVLSDTRGLAEFVKVFEKTENRDWILVLIGYSLGENLKKELKNSKKTRLLDAVSSQEVIEIAKLASAILMPYPVNDVNTKFGFANKLGDCIALKIPFLYNKELLTFDEVAQNSSSGLSFTWNEITKNPRSLDLVLESLIDLKPDWEKAEVNFGWKHFSDQINSIFQYI